MAWFGTLLGSLVLFALPLDLLGESTHASCPECQKYGIMQQDGTAFNEEDQVSLVIIYNYHIDIITQLQWRHKIIMASQIKATAMFNGLSRPTNIKWLSHVRADRFLSQGPFCLKRLHHMVAPEHLLISYLLLVLQWSQAISVNRMTTWIIEMN